MSLRSLAVLASSFAFLLSACGDTPSSRPDASGGSTSMTGGVSGSGAVAGGPNGGNAGSAAGGAAGAAGQGGSAGGVGSSGQAGLAGGGASGQSGAGGAAGAAGNGGGAGLGGGAGASGGQAGGGAGASAGQAGGGAGGRGGAGSGGSGGSGGAGGRGGAAGSSGGGGAATYNPCPAAPAPCVILPFGDSITDGFGTPGGYRIDLFRRTLTDGKRITFVGSAQNGPTMVSGMPFPRNHEGHSGFTIDTDAGHTGISPLVPTAIGFNPNIVLLMIGTNDINGNVNVGQAPTRLGNLIDAMFTRRQDMLVVVALIVPGRQDSLNARIMTYNAAIPNLVATRAAAGRHIVSVDMYGAFTRDANYKTTLLADDLHPTPAGYLRMSDTWYAAIGSLLR